MAIDALEPDLIEQQPALVVRFQHVGPLCVLAMTGDLGVGSLGILEAQVDRLGTTPCHEVVLDMYGLCGIDAPGVKVLTGLHHYVEARGGRLRLLGTSSTVARALMGTPLSVS